MINTLRNKTSIDFNKNKWYNKYIK
jgi:hypothetical protein